MKYATDTFEKLIYAFSRLPGIGEKSAERIALYLLQEKRQAAEDLANVILALKDRIRPCSKCHNLAEADLCNICQDTKRDRGMICVVEEPKDLLALEKAGGYRGLYHVLGGVLSPLDGIGESGIRIKELLNRLGPEIKEVILATNPTMEGEMTAAHLIKLLKDKNVKVTRIARGIPFGGTLEFNDVVTISKAMEGRVEVN